MQTVNATDIAADPDEVFTIVSDVLAWPSMLPHYRWVREVPWGEDASAFEMAAMRSCIPIKWTSLLTLDPANRRMHFEHVGGLTTGMRVVWQIDRQQRGTHVSIVHEFERLGVPVVRSFLGKIITGKVFVEPVADRTLRHMKQWIETHQSAPL